MKNETTKPAAALVADLPKPTQDIDLDAKAARCLAEAKKRTAEAWFENKCPPALRESDWSHPNLKASETAIRSILAWDSTSAKGIIASGPTGRGKSRAMWALMKRLAIDDRKDVKFWFAGDWFAMLQMQVNYGRDDARAFVEASARRQIVFLDDLGQEAVMASKADWAQGWFFRFLDLRVGNGLPLFVTTNITADQMAGSVNAVRANPLVRRLLDLATPIKFEHA